MVIVTMNEFVKAVFTLVVSLAIAIVFTSFSGYFNDPEAAREHQQKAQEVFESTQVVSQEQLDQMTRSSRGVESHDLSYSLMDDLHAAFRQSGLWLVLVHLIGLFLVKPRVVEVLVVAAVASALVMGTVRWPNPTPSICVSSLVYCLIMWGKRPKAEA